jgi:hypothetical protein
VKQAPEVRINCAKRVLKHKRHKLRQAQVFGASVSPSKTVLQKVPVSAVASTHCARSVPTRPSDSTTRSCTSGVEGACRSGDRAGGEAGVSEQRSRPAPACRRRREPQWSRNQALARFTPAFETSRRKAATV